MTTNTTTPTKLPLSATLKTIPATDGVEKLRTLHDQHHLIPSAAVTTIDTHLGRLDGVLRRTGVSAYHLATHSSPVLASLTGLTPDAITQYHPTAVMEPLHTYRNLALAVAALAATTVQVPTPATQPEAVYSHAIKLARRSIQIRRPFAHDEIVLCRVAALLAAHENPRDHTATIYTLTEAGLVPGETTHVSMRDLSDPELPQFLLAAGNAHLRERFVELDTYTQQILTRHASHARRAGHAEDKPLTYSPRARKDDMPTHQPGSVSATASAQRIIDRFLQQLRLPVTDITATSITQWRIATTLEAHGIDAALELSGRTNTAAMFRALGATSPAAARPADEEESFDAAV